MFCVIGRCQEMHMHALLKRIRNVFSGQPQKEEPLAKPTAKKRKDSSTCPHYYGYLTNLAKDAPIPQECLTCQEILECRDIWSAESGALHACMRGKKAFP